MKIRNEKRCRNKQKFKIPPTGTPIIHEAIAVTAIATLLNLNLNYEKLRDKNKKSFNNKKHYDVFFNYRCVLKAVPSPDRTY